MALLLTTRLTQLFVRVDLVGEVKLEEVLLLSLVIHGYLDLIKSLLRAKVRLVVQGLNSLFYLLSLLLLHDLVAQEVAIGLVLFLTVQHLYSLHVVHVVECGVELLLLRLTRLLDSLDLLIESLESLFVDGANLVVRLATLVCSVVVHGEGAL